MSRQFWLGLLLISVLAWGMDTDSLPVWNPAMLARGNSFVQNADALNHQDSSTRKDSLETHGYKTVQVTVGDGPKWHLLEVLKVPSTYRGMRIVYKYDDGFHDDFNVSEELHIEYYD